MSIGAIASVVIPKVIDVIDRRVSSEAEAATVRAEVIAEVLKAEAEAAKSGAQVLTAEAAGESWLQRNWRPITMIWFGFLIGMYWFGYVPENMPEEHISAIFGLVQIGLGGYVVGRSVEKVSRVMAPVLGSR